MNQPLVLMFDLEQTLINSWGSGTPLPSKINFIKDWINNNVDPNFLLATGLYSFAIDNDFESPQGIRMADNIITNFNLPIPFVDKDWVFPFDKMGNILVEIADISVDLQKWELVNLFGKELSFPIITKKWPDHDFVLFDDMLSTDSVIHRNDQTIRMVKV